MRIFINGKPVDTQAADMAELIKEQGFGDSCVSVLNGFGTDEGALHENDRVHLLDKTKLPDKDTLEELLYARHTPLLHEKFKNACVGIAGLGGLGSNIAVSLARTGIGRLVIADHDIVDPTNLNRQQYFIKHLGMFKTDALESIIRDINPYVDITKANVRLTKENAPEIFKDCSVVCEALDNAEGKSMLVDTLLQNTSARVVAASGLAGYEDANMIKTRKLGSRLILCGDGMTEAECGVGLMAPRAAICAGHQANAVLNILAEQN